MQFKILGPLEVRADSGELIEISRPLHRSALAVLLLNAGRPCSASALITALWGDDPPGRPDVSLRSCVYGVRQALAAPGRLDTRDSGYLFHVLPGELDLSAFGLLAAQGRDALDRGSPHDAARLLSQALGLWREPPLEDLPQAEVRARLADQHHDAQDALMDAELALGHHHDVLARLRGIAAAEPLREHTGAQLMTALYRCGARAEALAAFGRTRLALVGAWGMEPGPELQELHSRILGDDPALGLRPAAVGLTSAAPEPALCQLPAPVPDFTGRTSELSELFTQLPGEGMAVTVISGMPGAGKTALAVRASHLARRGFEGGQLYACLDDGGGPRDAQAVLGELLRGLAVSTADIPEPGPGREAMYRSALAGRKVLVVADGASAAAQVRPLLPGTPGSAVLVTSRLRLDDLDGALHIDLGPLLATDSVRLLTRIAGRSRAPADPGAAAALASACGHLPLALRIAGARLAADPGMTMADLAATLADDSRCLDELEVGDQSVRARLAASADGLSGAARRMLTLLAQSGGYNAAGVLTPDTLGEPAAPAAAAALADAGLLARVPRTGSDGPAYWMHPLVRAYAGELDTDGVSAEPPVRLARFEADRADRRRANTRRPA